MRDAFLTMNNTGQRGIRVRRGKHHKARIVVLGNWNNWVLACVQSYVTALGLTPESHPDAHIFRGVKRAKNHSYDSTPQRLSVRGAERAVQDYPAVYRGSEIRVNAHDLRRTFAKLCKEAGMTWEALREQMGHSSVTITEDYVGHEVEWSARIPNWTITLNS
jgi:integrase